MRKRKVRVINRDAFMINGKVVIRDNRGHWIRQHATYTPEETGAFLATIRLMDPGYFKRIRPKRKFGLFKIPGIR